MLGDFGLQVVSKCFVCGCFGIVALKWFQSLWCLVASGFWAASGFKVSGVWLFRGSWLQVVFVCLVASEFWLQVVSDFTVAGCFGTFGCNLL